MSDRMTRRELIKKTAILGCSAAASPLFTPITLASAPTEHRLVVIILRGAMDGLDIVQPYGDPALVGLRNSLKFGEAADAHDLDGFFSLHSGLGELMPLWNAGQLGFVHAVSTPYRDKRSHFDGQDFLENGGSSRDGDLTTVRDGWLNRALSLMPGVSSTTAFSVGRNRMLLLQGDAPTAAWSPDSDLDLSPRSQLLLRNLYQNDPLFSKSVEVAFELSDKMDNPMNPTRAARARALAQFSADRLNEDTRIAAFSIGGWDTHNNQSRTLRPALRELTDAIMTLKRSLGRNWERTAVLTLTEFGRTVRENGSNGTDHGTGGVMLMTGGAVRGGKVFGRWPGLGEGNLYEDRDLMPVRDVRAYVAWILRDLLNLESSAMQSLVFPGLDMGDKPSILL